MSQNPQNPPEQKTAPKKEVNLVHNFDYIGGTYAYKNSRKRKNQSPVTKTKSKDSVLITGYGRARPVSVAEQPVDPRAGVYPQHNSPDDFMDNIEQLAAKGFDVYKDLTDINNYEKKGFKHKSVTLTKEKVDNVYLQFSHLSLYAFNQMMCINGPDKRDFDVWYRQIPKNRQVIIAYPHSKTGLTQFIQAIQYGKEGEVLNIRHCLFDKGEPFVINETGVDKFGNVRQLAHIGVKGGSMTKNAVERFDDSTVTWTVTSDTGSGTAALRPSGEILVIGQDLNELNMLAARNLGAEGLTAENQWTGTFSLEACLANDHPSQTEYKNSVRKQLGQIVDGAAIPGLEPIFIV